MTPATPDARARPERVSPWTLLLAIAFLSAVGYAVHVTLRLRDANARLAQGEARPPIDLAGFEPPAQGAAADPLEDLALAAEEELDPAVLEAELAVRLATRPDARESLELGVLLVRRGRYGEATDRLLSATLDDRTRERALFFLFLVGEGTQNALAASRALSELASLPGPGRYAYLGRAILASREPGADPAKVGASFDRAVRSRPAGPDGAWSHLYRAAWRREKGDAEGARLDEEAARAVAPSAGIPSPVRPDGAQKEKE